MKRAADSLRLAVAFLTLVPVGLRGQAPSLGAAAVWFPAVGALIGALAGGVGYLVEPIFGAGVAWTLAAAVLVTLTGGLHQDGLADCADALGARGSRERRLAIMRDSSIGTFGGLALIFWVGLIVTALAGLDRDDAFRALVTAAATGRWAALVHARLTPAARREGLGAGFAVGWVALVIATLAAAGAALAAAGVVGGIAALVAATAVATLLTAWSRAALGGRTGDTLGATVALTEVTVALALLGLSPL